MFFSPTLFPCSQTADHTFLRCPNYAVCMSKTTLQSRKFFAILLLTVAPALCQSNRSLAKTAPRIQGQLQKTDQIVR